MTVTTQTVREIALENPASIRVLKHLESTTAAADASRSPRLARPRISRGCRD